MPAYRRRRSASLATQAFELAMAAPEVVAHRMARMSRAGPTPSLPEQLEMVRMGSEKVAAFYESWGAMMMEMYRANLRFALSPAAHWWTPWTGGATARRALSGHAQRTALAMLGKGLAPVHRRTLANVRRLRRGISK